MTNLTGRSLPKLKLGTFLECNKLNIEMLYKYYGCSAKVNLFKFSVIEIKGKAGVILH